MNNLNNTLNDETKVQVVMKNYTAEVKKHGLTYEVSTQATNLAHAEYLFELSAPRGAKILSVRQD